MLGREPGSSRRAASAASLTHLSNPTVFSFLFYPVFLKVYPFDQPRFIICHVGLGVGMIETGFLLVALTVLEFINVNKGDLQLSENYLALPVEC